MKGIDYYFCCLILKKKYTKKLNVIYQKQWLRKKKSICSSRGNRIVKRLSYEAFHKSQKTTDKAVPMNSINIIPARQQNM